MKSNLQTFVRSSALCGVGALLEELGVDAAALAGECGLDSAALDNPELPVPGTAVVTFFEAAAERSGREDFGLLLSARQDLSILGPVWVAMRQAGTLFDALQLLSRFFVVHTNGAVVGLQRLEDGGAVLSYAIRADVAVRDRQTIELGFALVCQELRRLCGADWMPRAVQFAHAAPQRLAVHRGCFGTHLRFGQERNALWLDRECLLTPIGGPSDAEHASQQSLLARHVDRVQAAAAEVENAMRALMPFADCSREQVADFIGQSPRTMLRWLARSGTTFHHMRDRVRADIAMKYLLQSTLSAREIAEILGYSNPAAFTRAFRRQHGMAPTAVRRRAA
jgi:AraC-like DNA-binding protein